MKHSNEISKAAETNIRIGIAKFTFENGDNYEGKYQIDFDRCTLVKQGYNISSISSSYQYIYYLDWQMMYILIFVFVIAIYRSRSIHNW